MRWRPRLYSSVARSLKLRHARRPWLVFRWVTTREDRALRHIRPFLDSETTKTIACAIVGSRLHYVSSILTGISSCNIHRLQRVQNSLARVVTRSTNNTTSTLNSPHWHPIQQRIYFKLATLVHRSLHNAGPQYLSSLLHPYTLSCQLRSASLNLLSQLRINFALASRGFRHAGPSPSSSQIYRLSHCLQIQSKNSPFLGCKHFWPLTILSTRFRFDIIMFIFGS